MNCPIPPLPLAGPAHLDPQLHARPKPPSAGLAVDTTGAVAALVHSTAKPHTERCSDAGASPVAAFWQLEPQEFKRQANLNLLANNAVYDAGLQTPIYTAAAMLELQFRATPAPNGKRLVPLKCFIEELLRRSRTSFSTLQLALLYLLRFKQTMGARSVQHPSDRGTSSAMPTATSCARRMFLSALIVANKYLQDRNYSNTAWSRICGLCPAELTKNEAAFLAVMDWKLFVPKRVFVRWSTMLLTASAQMTKQKAVKRANLGADAARLLPTPSPLINASLKLSAAHTRAPTATTAPSVSHKASFAPLTPPAEFGGPSPVFQSSAASTQSLNAIPATSYSTSSSCIPNADLWCGAERVEDMIMGTPADGHLPSPDTRSVKVGSKRGIDLVDDNDNDEDATKYSAAAAAAARRHVGWPTV
ncbi:hypothetical protein HDU86_007465 [Geranomyces michiganensis]|nr:hypothetical protein HDU86_007465 [Geranomyces michiganensis]